MKEWLLFGGKGKISTIDLSNLILSRNYVSKPLISERISSK